MKKTLKTTNFEYSTVVRIRKDDPLKKQSSILDLEKICGSSKSNYELGETCSKMSKIVNNR